jgi:FkbM family methyltransferase
MNAQTLAKSLAVLRKLPLIGRSLRWLIRRYREGSVTRIQAGAARGIRWRRYHRYDPGTWLGTHEPQVQQALVRLLKGGDVFYDIGANTGFFSILSASIVGANGQVIAFEPHPLNIESIKAQIEVNEFKNISVVPNAVSSQNGAVRFFASDNLSQGRLGVSRSGDEAMEVEAMTLDQAVDMYAPPSHIKVDIEGGGADLVLGARKATEIYKPVWIIEVHDREEERAFKELLLPLGYHFESLDQRMIDPDGGLPEHVIAVCDSKRQQP